MSLTLISNIGSYITGAAIGAGTATAGGTGDGTKVTGQTIDRSGYSSGVVQIAYKAALAETKTISFAVEVQESEDGSTWDTAVVLQAATVAATGGTGGSTAYGVVEIDEDLRGRKRYVRYNVTPDLNATSTDTLTWGGAFVLGGAATIPA